MNIAKANDLFASGTLSDLFQCGIISYKIFEYREIYLFVDARMKAEKCSQNKAVEMAEIKFNKCRATIFKALKTFSE